MFRLKNAAERAAYRAAMTPKGATKDERSSDAGEVFCYEGNGKLYAIAFVGSAGRPTWHYSFKDAARREAKLAEFFGGLKLHAEYKSTQRAARTAFVHGAKVGDVFRSSWGYDQTNIDFYQIVRLIGKHYAEVREICQHSQETAYMQGECVPAVNEWATEADYSAEGEAHKAQHGHYPRKPKASRRVKLQGYAGGEPSFRVASYASATRVKPVAVVAGAPVYGASHWTAYA